MNVLISFCLILLSFTGLSQTIPSHRLSNWSNVGSGYISHTNAREINVDSLQLANPSQDLGQIINEVIHSSQSPLKIVFGKGTYNITSEIILRSNVSLIGIGNATKLNFNTSTTNCIVISGTKQNATYALETDLIKGSSSIKLVKQLPMKERELFLLQSNDSSLVSSDWAIGSTGQLLTVKSNQNSTIIFEEEFNRHHSVANQPRVIKVNPINNVQISNVSITRLKEVPSQGNAIKLQYATNCKIECVSFYNSDFAHIGLNYSANNTIEGCFFKDAFNYGGGGNGYGVVVQFASSSNLILNNVFTDLRHSILLQAGANGNAIAYNYSIKPYWTGTWLPANSAGDLVLHGNYVYSNLFEGNCVQNIVIDGSHGINGKHNLFFKNRAEDYGIFMDISTPTDSQLFVGNEITNKDGNALYILSGNGHFEYGNKVKGETLPANTDNISITSFLSKELASNHTTAFGNSRKTETNYFNNSEQRHALGNKTKCEAVAVSNNIDIGTKLMSYPNPCSDYFTIEGLSATAKIQILNAEGRLIFETINKDHIYISQLSKGMYIVIARDNNLIYSTRLAVSH